MFDRLRVLVRSLRVRLILWNAGAVLLTAFLILLSVREGVRYTLVLELDQVLHEDLREIELYFADQGTHDWYTLQDELNRKAVGHDYHGWFVQFYDAAGNITFASVNAPEVPPWKPRDESRRAFTHHDLRLLYRPLKSQSVHAAVCVGCRKDFIARDMDRIDRLVLLVGGLSLAASPLVGFFLTSRAITPLAQMIRTTGGIRPGELAQRVPLRGTGDELDRLAYTINGLLDRITDYLAQEHDFLADAAHELRTPLAAIRSSVEVALNGDRTEEEYRDLLNLVIDQCSALQTLVNQLLLLAETDSDRLQVDPDPVDLSRLVRQAIEMFQGVAEANGITVRVNAMPGVTVAGNRHHLRQVLNNLLDNAVKFTAVKFDQSSAGGIQVELACDAPARQARLTIEDNGVGISPADLPHVFDRFYRANKARSRGRIDSGSGLGLSICSAIVEAHHGTIAAASAPGQGTSVVVTLPLFTKTD